MASSTAICVRCVWPGATLAAVGKEFGITRQRVSQIVGPEATAAKMAQAAAARAEAAASKADEAAERAAVKEAERRAGEHPQEAFGIKVGDTVGRWKVLSIGWKDMPGRQERVRMAVVRCSCPDQTVKTVHLHNLRRGVTKSCGCYRRERMRDRMREAPVVRGAAWLPTYPKEAVAS